MNNLAQIYKQANDDVLKRYQEEPEDRWKVNAITEHRSGIRNHDSVMADFAEDVERTVDELVNATKSVPQTVAPTTPPNAKPIDKTKLPKTPDNPQGIDLDWN